MVQVQGSQKKCADVVEWLAEQSSRLSQGHSLVSWDKLGSEKVAVENEEVPGMMEGWSIRFGFLDTTDLCWVNVPIPVNEGWKTKAVLPPRIRRALCNSKGRENLAAGGKFTMVKDWLTTVVK